MTEILMMTVVLGTATLALMITVVTVLGWCWQRWR
jgi:uncharacterized membrane protein